ncbi:hypothetical protein E2C01_040770 [Portunus trituberculatus]|uniref:Secreted protein n=1 Tax=Portunus trituberculatus TaxID=210409 RepID=A0A5B7FNC6_PORTR|nr:hypothetical protein [Portunus trituberculatus]
MNFFFFCLYFFSVGGREGRPAVDFSIRHCFYSCGHSFIIPTPLDGTKDAKARATLRQATPLTHPTLKTLLIVVYNARVEEVECPNPRPASHPLLLRMSYVTRRIQTNNLQ